MAMALRLAAKAEYATSPNPMVGCVVVANGEVVGSGWHHRAGEAHAEVLALEAAGDKARGADVYVTLEPCAHHGKTPPCTDALLAAAPARVIVAMEDPNPEVAGRGIAALRAAGIEVTTGVCEDPARRLNEFFVTHITTGLPFVTAKFAASLDGRIATRTGASRWISSPESRRHAHLLRHMHDAIIVGSSTVLADDPSLTSRDPEGAPQVVRQPLRVVLDSTLRTPPGSRILDTPGTLVMTTEAAPQERAAALEARGAEVITLPAGDGGIAIDAVLRHLGERGCISALVEGGAHLLGSVFDAGAADKVVAYLAPRIIGGAGASPAVLGNGVAALDAAGTLRDLSVERRGDDVVVSAYCVR